MQSSQLNPLPPNSHPMADSGLDIVARWLENNRQADDFLGQTDISQPPPIATQGDNFDIPFRFDAEAWDWPSAPAPGV